MAVRKLSHLEESASPIENAQDVHPVDDVESPALGDETGTESLADNDFVEVRDHPVEDDTETSEVLLETSAVQAEVVAAATLEVVEPEPKQLWGWANVGSDGVVRGWANNQKDAELRLTIDLMVDGELVASVVASEFRKELEFGDRHYGFTAALPLRFCDGQVHSFRAAVSGFDAELRSRTPEFQIDAQALPAIFVDGVTPSSIVGRVVGATVLKSGSFILAGEGQAADPDHSVTAWHKSVDVEHPFAVMLNGPLSVSDVLERDWSVCYPGDRAHERSASVWRAAKFAWEISANTLTIRVADDFILPEGFQAWLEYGSDVMGQPKGVSSLPVEFYGNQALVPLAEAPVEGEGFNARLTRGGTSSGGPELSSFTRRPQRLPPLTNTDFDIWLDGRPAAWELSSQIQVDRGLRAVERSLPAAMSTNTLVLDCGAVGAGDLILRQTLRTADPETDWTSGLVARAGSPARIEARLVDATGHVLQTVDLAITRKWQMHQWSLVLSEEDAQPAAIEFRWHSEAEDGDRTWLEFDGIDCVEGARRLFKVPRPPSRRIRDHGNLIENAALNRWPKAGLPAPTTGRFEAAEGWFINNPKAKAPVSAAAVPLVIYDQQAEAGTYALSVSAPEVSRYCRIEVAVRPGSINGTGKLQLAFNAAAAAISDNGAARLSRVGEWAFIDRIFLLRRPDDSAAGGDIACDIARRLLLTKTREPFTLDVEIEPDAAGDQSGTAFYYVVFEYHAPFSLTLDSPRLLHQVGAPETVSAIIELEDRNIAAQIGSVAGCEHWLAAEAIKPYGGPARGTASEAALRWNWNRDVHGTVEVVVCVYDAIEETLDCLRSLAAATTVPHTVLIVDDGSGPETAERLEAFVSDKPWMRIVTNTPNMGYTRAADRGIRSSRADWVVLLNSDTIVSAGWLEGLLDCALSDPKIAFAGPVSNAATYQSVPELYDTGGKWAVNVLPEGWTAATMAELVGRVATKTFPRVPLLNGFCTLIKRSVFLEVGGLDGQAFPVGYGEENDLCLRVANAGYELAVADHVYVYHSKSASFGTKRREELSKQGNRSLKAKHPEVNFAVLGRGFLETPALATLRGRVRDDLAGKVEPLMKTEDAA